LPGMAVLQFAFDEFEDNPHKPWNITRDTVAYTGTHDNDTTAGWFAALSQQEQSHVRDLLGMDPDDDPVWSMIDTIMASKAWLAMIPMQDFLSLGAEDRMNTPGTVENNWTWQFRWDQVSSEITEKIAGLVNASDRDATREGAVL